MLSVETSAPANAIGTVGADLAGSPSGSRLMTSLEFTNSPSGRPVCQGSVVGLDAEMPPNKLGAAPAFCTSQSA